MNKIDQLKADIVEIEENIDTEDKSLLYDILIIAYFKAKDIIELYDEANPVQQVDDTSSETAEELVRAKETITSLGEKVADIGTKLEAEIASNTAACMERDKYLTILKTISTALNSED